MNISFWGKLYQFIRKVKYRLLSENKNVIGKPFQIQPVIYCGKGKISFQKNVMLGSYPSPFFYNGMVYLEARNAGAEINFGNNIHCNNNLSIICDNSNISIGDGVLIGTNVEIIDSDFHELHPEKRNSGNHRCRPVKIERNVFLGSNVRILKGVTIGENSVIANGSVVFESMPKNVIVAGNPATVIRNIVV